MVKTDGSVYPKTSTNRRFLAIGVPKLFSLIETGVIGAGTPAVANETRESSTANENWPMFH
eukprot:11222749-Lingulodinium_polyedra.AAC.1